MASAFFNLKLQTLLKLSELKSHQSLRIQKQVYLKKQQLRFRECKNVNFAMYYYAKEREGGGAMTQLQQLAPYFFCRNPTTPSLPFHMQTLPSTNVIVVRFLFLLNAHPSPVMGAPSSSCTTNTMTQEKLDMRPPLL